MTKHITIRDIAKEAGVSIALVSFVMNNRVDADGKQKYRVKEETRQRVLDVARRLHYQPNSAARSLRQGHTRVLGAIVPDISNIFYGQIARVLEDIAYQHGYTVLFGSSDEDTGKFKSVVESFLDKGVEGFFVVPCKGCAPLLLQVQQQGIPIVLVDRYRAGLPLPAVVTDNRSAMEKALNVLLAQGARKMALVSYGLRVASLQDREDRFRSYLSSLGLDGRAIYRVPFGALRERADAIAESVMAAGTEGLVLGSNAIAAAIIQSLVRQGVRIQEDIHIVGFDYSNVYDVFVPRIPYVLQAQDQMSQLAAEKLFALLKKKDAGEMLSAEEDLTLLPAQICNFPIESIISHE